MRRIPIGKPISIFSDFLIVFAIGSVIYGLTAFGRHWEASYNPDYQIRLSLTALPLYAFFSALRGFVAYVISLIFTLVVGFWAAKSKAAERVILPILDVMQSIPVLGFLPGLVLGLVAIFPHTNVGLELASILMIFTGQVWNMAFAFYSSLKSIPTDLREAAEVMKLSGVERFRFLELPYSAMNLTWNSVMSMAGGWFFLTVCEAFTLGNNNYRLPGLGAYMAVAIDAGDTRAIILGILAMVAVILLFDLFLWKPALAWAHSFRLEESETDAPSADEPLIQLIIRDSKIIRVFRRFSRRRKFLRGVWNRPSLPKLTTLSFVVSLFAGKGKNLPKFFSGLPLLGPRVKKALFWLIGLGLLVGGIALCWDLIEILRNLDLALWQTIFADTGFTLMRVFGAVLIGTLWAVPAGIWISQSARRLRLAQPIIQLAASFPAPMLYPLAIGLFIMLKINFQISSMLLMLLGVQWYILFNVLAGGLRIPNELRLAMDLMKCPTWHKWRFLFLPSVLPSLVTGWVTAAGGAWNASIVSEIVSFKGQQYSARGLGADISEAAAKAEFPRLAACLLVMILVVVLLNRLVWARLYNLVQTRYRLDL
jgi:NitT/TauT family transport system permease protein